MESNASDDGDSHRNTEELSANGDTEVTSKMSTLEQDGIEVTSACLTEFHRFADMPPELQASVWNHALPPIWGYKFRFQWAHDEAKDDMIAAFEPSKHVFGDTRPHRALLSTCWASRREVLASYHLLPVNFDLDDSDLDNIVVRKAHIPFDKQFGYFCIEVSLNQEDDLSEDLRDDYLEVIYGDSPSSELQFLDWYGATFGSMKGLDFGHLVDRVVFLFEAPESVGEDADFGLVGTDGIFTLQAWGLIRGLHQDDKIYLALATIPDGNFRLDPSFPKFLEWVDVPAVCKHASEQTQQVQYGTRDEFESYRFSRRVVVAQAIAYHLELDSSLIWYDEEWRLRTFDELEMIADGFEMLEEDFRMMTDEADEQSQLSGSPCLSEDDA